MPRVEARFVFVGGVQSAVGGINRKQVYDGERMRDGGASPGVQREPAEKKGSLPKGSIDSPYRRRLRSFVMGSFTIRPLGLAVLFGFLAVITLILVLPQVDLLDTAFQRSTSPLAIHARSTTAPATGTEVREYRLALAIRLSPQYEVLRELVHAILADPAEVLNQSFRC